MARTTGAQKRLAPEKSELLTLYVRRRRRLSPTFERVTLGGPDLARFTPMGADQWFRLFLPVAGGTLTRLPNRLDTFAYLRYLAIAKTQRPVLRNYTVAGFRADGAQGPELDVDFVRHGSAAAGTAGPAASWAETCAPGDAVAILDEGVLFAPPADLRGPLAFVGDETALPALAGILASLPAEATGRAFIEVPDAGDVRTLAAPARVEVAWIVRDDPHATPGYAVLTAAVEASEAEAVVPAYAWVAGEQSLVAAMRRHWVRVGVDKRMISFTGYWRASRPHLPS
ncbi:siderophore-interacting protein [Microbacterium sp. lyk4-40-TSB-66]|uniref:siderophore-interacting protein n=1 Tax=Microbacterium sp. lyk4-40-TSB-66 TaxID=3040294 RepID=UPI00254EB03E|nr:siderophore-interacting protein [Microbacterium sp. lyk4-40-TSB-66]